MFTWPVFAAEPTDEQKAAAQALQEEMLQRQPFEVNGSDFYWRGNFQPRVQWHQDLAVPADFFGHFYPSSASKRTSDIEDVWRSFISDWRPLFPYDEELFDRLSFRKDRVYGNETFSVHVLHVLLDGTKILDQGVRILTDNHGRLILARISLDEDYYIANSISITPADAEAAVRHDMEVAAGSVRKDVHVYSEPLLHGNGGNYFYVYQVEAVCAGPENVCGPFEYRVDTGTGRVLEKRPLYYPHIECDLSDYDLNGYGSMRVYDINTVGGTIDIDPYDGTGTHFYSRFIPRGVEHVPPYCYYSTELSGCPIDEVCFDFTGWANSCFVFDCSEIVSTNKLVCDENALGGCSLLFPQCSEFLDAVFYYPDMEGDDLKRRMLITAYDQIQRLVFAVLDHFPTGVPLLNNQEGSTLFDDVFDLYIEDMDGYLGVFSSLWGCDDSIRLNPFFFNGSYLTTPIHEAVHSIQWYYFGGYDHGYFVDAAIGETIPTVFASFLNGYSYDYLEKQVGYTTVEYCRQKYYSILSYVPENYQGSDYKRRSWEDCRTSSDFYCGNVCITNQDGCDYSFNCTEPNVYRLADVLASVFIEARETFCDEDLLFKIAFTSMLLRREGRYENFSDLEDDLSDLLVLFTETQEDLTYYRAILHNAFVHHGFDEDLYQFLDENPEARRVGCVQ